MNLENLKLLMPPSLMIGCKLHQDAVTFHFHLSVFSQGKLKIQSNFRVGDPWRCISYGQMINLCNDCPVMLHYLFMFIPSSLLTRYPYRYMFEIADCFNRSNSLNPIWTGVFPNLMTGAQNGPSQ